MASTKQRIKTLYHRLKENSISDVELNEFLDLLDHEDARKGLDPEIQDTWSSLKSIEESNEIRAQKFELKTKLKVFHTEKKRWRQKTVWLYGTAASIVILIALTVLLKDVFSTSIEYSTGFGERQKIDLPDGSKVELNANSTLVWNNDWKQSGVRNVQLKGEAYFDVSHLEENQKFIVSTKDLDIEVLGTSFNVSNRSDITDVFLDEGSVKLELKGRMEKELMMEPGDMISYSKKDDHLTEHISTKKELAASWQRDVLYFDNKSLEEILNEVSQIYGVEFEIENPTIKDLKLNFYVPYKDWDTTKEAFELTMNLKIQKQENGKYLVRKN